MQSSGSFLDVLKRTIVERFVLPGIATCPATQARRPTNPTGRFEFGFATGVECSNPMIADAKGNRVRRDMLKECGHYNYWCRDLQLVKDMNIPILRYGIPNHLVHLGPDRYDWSFPDDTIGEIRRLGILPIVDLLHFGLPDWMGDFQNPEFPVLFAQYAGAVAQRYGWVRAYTPVNKMYVAARNSGWDGIWNERLRSERGFVTALKHLVAANILASAAIVRHRPNAVMITSESAEYTHHVNVAPSHDFKLRNKLVYIPLDLLYSKAPDADVLMFLQDNGMTRDEFMWFMSMSPPGYHILGNDYYGRNEKIVLPDGSVMSGEDVLGWYLVTARYYRRYLKPLFHTETNVFNPNDAVRWLWKQWTNVLRMRRDGAAVLGFTWYSLCDQIDWDTQLAEQNNRVNECGLFDMDRKPRPVAAAYRELIKEFATIASLAHGEMFEFTNRNAVPRAAV
jgi:beta-glucosidase/6-phospho-beta-glucosidase/beta-galactosidase